MNRRSFIKGIIGATAGAFIVPEIIVPERRVWALDRTMVPEMRGPQVWLVGKGYAELGTSVMTDDARLLQAMVYFSEVKDGDIYTWEEEDSSMWLHSELGDGFILTSRFPMTNYKYSG